MLGPYSAKKIVGPSYKVLAMLTHCKT